MQDKQVAPNPSGLCICGCGERRKYFYALVKTANWTVLRPSAPKPATDTLAVSRLPRSPVFRQNAIHRRNALTLQCKRRNTLRESSSEGSPTTREFAAAACDSG